MPADQWLEVARQVKEAHCYVCSDVAKVQARPVYTAKDHPPLHTC